MCGNGVLDALKCRLQRSVQDRIFFRLDCHDLDFVRIPAGNRRDALAIIGDSGRDPGHMRTMLKNRIGRCCRRIGIIVIHGRIPAVNIINIAIAIIINVIARNFPGICPYIRLQIFMVQFDRIIHDRDHHISLVGISVVNTPGLRCIDLG